MSATGLVAGSRTAPSLERPAQRDTHPLVAQAVAEAAMIGRLQRGPGAWLPAHAGVEDGTSAVERRGRHVEWHVASGETLRRRDRLRAGGVQPPGARPQARVSACMPLDALAVARQPALALVRFGPKGRVAACFLERVRAHPLPGDARARNESRAAEADTAAAVEEDLARARLPFRLPPHLVV